MKRNGYNLIIVIINNLTKIVYYISIKTIINIAKQAKITIKIEIRDNNFANAIKSNQNVLFTSQFLLSLAIFNVEIKAFDYFWLPNRLSNQEIK